MKTSCSCSLDSALEDSVFEDDNGSWLVDTDEKNNIFYAVVNARTNVIIIVRTALYTPKQVVGAMSESSRNLAIFPPGILPMVVAYMGDLVHIVHFRIRSILPVKAITTSPLTHDLVLLMSQTAILSIAERDMPFVCAPDTFVRTTRRTVWFATSSGTRRKNMRFFDLAHDSDGRLYFGDSGNHGIWQTDAYRLLNSSDVTPLWHNGVLWPCGKVALTKIIASGSDICALPRISQPPCIVVIDRVKFAHRVVPLHGKITRIAGNSKRGIIAQTSDSRCYRVTFPEHRDSGIKLDLVDDGIPYPVGVLQGKIIFWSLRSLHCLPLKI